MEEEKADKEKERGNEFCVIFKDIWLTEVSQISNIVPSLKKQLLVQK